MKNKIIIPALISIALFSIHPHNMNVKSESNLQNPDTSKFEQVFFLGLQGNITNVLSYLDTLHDENLTERQTEIKQKYYSRFRNNDENYKFITTDIEVIDLMKLYHNYWRGALLDNSLIKQFDSSLTKSVTGFLKKNYNNIINTEILRHLEKPFIKLELLSQEEVQKEELYWKNLRTILTLLKLPSFISKVL